MDTFKITKNFENELKNLFYGVLNEFFEEKNKEWRTERETIYKVKIVYINYSKTTKNKYL
ncbi:MAG: hypothetical protein IBX44_04195 [Sulfurospirillum sp.]|nr:hypothetical protein [Sulfurospirillum sp.]